MLCLREEPLLRSAVARVPVLAGFAWANLEVTILLRMALCADVGRCCLPVRNQNLNHHFAIRRQSRQEHDVAISVEVFTAVESVNPRVCIGFNSHQRTK